MRWAVLVACSRLAIACAPPCVDDGLHAKQHGVVCVVTAATGGGTSGTTSVTTTGGATTGDCGCTTGGGATGTGGATSSGGGSSSGSTGATSGGSSSGGGSTGAESSGGSTGAGSTGGLSCADGQQNGDESDVDCGGSCTPCEDFLQCNDSGDCASQACHFKGLCVPASCVDGVFDPQTERYLDCGLLCGPTCGLGFPCIETPDCFEGTCQDTNSCQLDPHCDNNNFDPGESDLDCGQECGATCKPGQICFENNDCYSKLCANGVCDSSPECQDLVQGQEETDIDCGGTCSGCALLQKCVIAEDCGFELSCVGGLCS